MKRVLVALWRRICIWWLGVRIRRVSRDSASHTVFVPVPKKPISLMSFDEVLKDHYPMPGTRIKQYVLDARKDSAWERETCPRFAVPAHNDNTGMPCCFSEMTPTWADLADHDCCYMCNDDAERRSTIGCVMEWKEAKAARTAPTEDRDALSDQVEPDHGLAMSPALAMFTRAPR